VAARLIAARDASNRPGRRSCCRPSGTSTISSAPSTPFPRIRRTARHRRLLRSTRVSRSAGLQPRSGPSIGSNRSLTGHPGSCAATDLVPHTIRRLAPANDRACRHCREGGVEGVRPPFPNRRSSRARGRAYAGRSPACPADNNGPDEQTWHSSTILALKSCVARLAPLWWMIAAGRGFSWCTAAGSNGVPSRCRQWTPREGRDTRLCSPPASAREVGH